MKVKILVCLMAFLAATFSSRAETVAPYTETFEDVNVSEIGFHPKGWGHIMYSTSYYRATYTLVTDQADSPYLTCKQYYTYDAYRDCLVSPRVTGKTTLQVKKTTDDGQVKFYTVTESSTGTLSYGSQITPDTAPELTDEFQTYEFTSLAPGTRIAIWAHNAAFKNFTAESADVVLFEQLAVTVVLSETSPAFTGTSGSNRTLALTESGDYTITFKVTLNNKGEVDYDTSTDNYTLTLKIGAEEIETVTIKAQSIPAGSSVSDYYTFELNGNETSGKVNYYIYENVDGKNYNDYDFINNVIPWHSEFLMQESATTTSSVYNVKNGSTYDFGSITEDATHKYYIHNTGTAPLTFEMTVSDGFTATLPQGNEVAAGSNVPVEFGISTESYGPKSGTLTFSTNDKSVASFMINLKGNVLDPDVYWENFAEGKLPNDMISEGNWAFSKTTTAGYAQNQYSTVSKLILPKLRVSEDEEMLIKASRSSSYYPPTFKIYKSADRNNWELVGDFGGDVTSEYSTTNYVDINISGVEAGEWYFAIEGAYLRIGEIYGFHRAQLDYDLVVTAQTVPAQGEVNSSFSTQMTVRNVGPALTADSYKAVLYVDGTAVGTAETMNLTAGGSQTFNFTHVPHAAGSEIPVEMKLEYLADGSVMATSAPATIAISEEVMRGELVMGEKTNIKQNKSIIYGYSKYNWGDVLYPASSIPVENGTKITRIAFHATYTGSPKGNVKVWIENTDLEKITDKWTDPEEEPTLVLEDYTFEKDTDNEEALVLDFSDNPFVYTGQNLRMRFKTEMSTQSSLNWYVDSKTGTCYYNYESSDRNSTTLYSVSAPVVYFSIIAEPIEVSGTVTGKDDEPVNGAKVTVKSGDVEYYAESNESGEYSVTLMKALEGYSVNVTAPGYFDYSSPIDITEGSLTHDVQLIEAKGLFIPAVAIPTAGMVNYPLNIKATVENCEPTATPAYTVNLYVDGVKAATIEGEELAGNTPDRTNEAAQKEYTFKYVPRNDGEFEVYVTVEWGLDEEAQSYASESGMLSVAPESAEGEVTVGHKTGYSQYTPMYVWETNWSQSETCYSPETLGLPAGAEIRKLTYRGYFNPSPTYLTDDIEFTVWMKNSSEPMADGQIFNKEDMTEVYTGTQHFEYAGSQNEPVVLLEFELDNPIQYDGGYLYVMFESDAAYGRNIYFEVDNSEKSYYRTKQSSGATETVMPVVTIGFDHLKIYSGTVAEDTAERKAIEGALVTIISGDVEYSALTDATGYFEIPVVQHTLDFTVRVEHPEYLTFTENIEDLDAPATHLLVKNVVSVEGIENRFEGLDPDQPMYNIYGIRVDADYRGVVIQNGRKYILK